MRVLRRRWLLLPALALLSVWAVGATAEDEYQGSEVCAVCHEDVAEGFKRTLHAVAPGWDADRSCENCRGPGTEHVDSGGEIPPPIRPAELSPEEASENCLSCHRRQEKHFSSAQSMHRLGDVGCVDCHNPHSTAPRMIDKTTKQLCSSCHQAIASQFDLPRSHPLPDDGPACATCHEPHGGKSYRSSTPLFDQTCTDCHFEKAGPFLFNHDVINMDGCASCHEVHGSPNRHLLKHETQVNLCYQCHSAGVTPDWHSAVLFLGEKCTACHTAIHGSNTHPNFLEE